MADKEDFVNLVKVVFEDNKQEKNLFVWFVGSLFQISNCLYVASYCFFLWIIFDCFWKIRLSKTFDESAV